MSEVNLKIEKIQKTSKVVLILANIIKIFFIISAVFCLVAGFIALGFKDEIDAGIAWAMDNNYLRMEDIGWGRGMKADILTTIIEKGHLAEALGGYTITAGIMLGAMAVMFHFIGKLFKDFRESYSPFQLKLVKELKVIFVFIALFAFESSLLVGALVSLALWCVIQIFDYGCELQRESDETL